MAFSFGVGSTSSRRRILSIGAVGFGGVALAACGAGAGSPKSAGKDTLGTVLFWTGGAGDAEMAPKRTADFMAEYPKIKVTVEDPGDLGVKVPAAAAAGTLGDILLQ